MIINNFINNVNMFLLSDASLSAHKQQVATLEIARGTNKLVGPISDFLGYLCNMLFNFVYNISDKGSLGITIILFTIFVRILIIPISIYQQKSAVKMRKIQPEMKKIQDKYKGKKDPELLQKMRVEMAQLNKKHGYNQLQGCLPMLIQMPILLAFFYVLQRVYLFIDKIGLLYSQIADCILKIDGIGTIITPFIQGIKTLQRFSTKGRYFDLTVADNCREVISKMGPSNWLPVIQGADSATKEMLMPLLEQKQNIEYFLGVNLVENPTYLSISVLIPLISGLTTFLSTYMINKVQGPAMDEQTASMQKNMLMVMPIVMGFMTFSFPAGLGLYWIVGNIVQIIQQYVFNRIFTIRGNNSVVDDKGAVK